jgi:hypothetical protein
MGEAIISRRGGGGKVIKGLIITPSTVNQAIPKGVHDGTGYVKGDANLVAGNIRHGVNVFGVIGTLKERFKSISGYESKHLSIGPGDIETFTITLPLTPMFIFFYPTTGTNLPDMSTFSKIFQLSYGNEVGAKYGVWSKSGFYTDPALTDAKNVTDGNLVYSIIDVSGNVVTYRIQNTSTSGYTTTTDWNFNYFAFGL